MGLEHPVGWKRGTAPRAGAHLSPLGWIGLLHRGRRGGCPGLCCVCLCYYMVSYFLIVNKSGLEKAKGISGRSTLLFLQSRALHSSRVTEGWRGLLVLLTYLCETFSLVLCCHPIITIL